MTKSSEVAERSVDFTFGDTSVIEGVQNKPTESVNKTIVSESYYVADRPTTGKNISTLESLRQQFTEVSPDDIKKINRANTSKISQAERDKIFNERDELVEKKFKTHLSAQEERRLTYIRWQLDRFDDAESGEFLDYIGKITESHEKLAEELKGFTGEIEKLQISKPKKRKGKSDR